MLYPRNPEEWLDQPCPECGVSWSLPSPGCPRYMYDRHPRKERPDMSEIKGNDHDLIMQFARGTEALTLFSELSALADEYDARRQSILSIYETSLRNLYQDYYGQVDRAIRHTGNRLRDLTADDDGYHEAAEIED